MAKATELLEVVNNHLVDDDAEFADGFYNGYLYYYDTNHQLSYPLSCQSVYTFLSENLNDTSKSHRWNAGFVFGWSAALSENHPDYFFTSILLPDAFPTTQPVSLSLLQEV